MKQNYKALLMLLLTIISLFGNYYIPHSNHIWKYTGTTIILSLLGIVMALSTNKISNNSPREKNENSTTKIKRIRTERETKDENSFL